MMIKKIAQLISNSFLFFLGGLAIFILAYRFGWVLLAGGLGWGNDLPFALSFAYYLERWWPYLPRWHYEWGGGMPFLRSYPILITYLTVFFHHLSGLSIVQTAKLFSWLSFPLAGVGIMIFARLVLKNWLLATLSGLFFILSPDAWLWIMFGGFYAATASFPFMVFTFVFFELGWQQQRRIWWILTVIFSGLTWLTHPITGTCLLIGLGVYGLGRGLGQRKFWFGLTRPVFVGLAGILLVAFWILPFALHRPGGIGVAAHQIVYVTLKEFFGLVSTPDHAKDYVTSVLLSGAVGALAIVGIFFSFLRRDKKVWVFLACSLVGLFFMAAPGIFPWLLQGPLLTLWALINVRAVVLPRLFVPIIAAYGAISLGETPFRLVAWFWKKLKNNPLWQLATPTIGGAMALVVVYLAFKYIVIIPAIHPPEYFYPGYGPIYFWLDHKEIDGRWMINSGKQPMFPSVEESLKQLLTLNRQIDDVPVRESVYFPELVQKAGLTSKDRIDISLLSGSVIASWNTTTDVSLVAPYSGNETSLMRSMIGYEQACLGNFTPEFICLKDEIKSLAKWWGLKMVYIGFGGRTIEDKDKKSLDNLKLADFKEKAIVSKNETILIYEVPENSTFATLNNKPMILVIGNNPPHNDGYNTAFRSFNRFGLDYDRVIPVPGKRFIDDHSLEELKKYPLVVLFGYRYHNRNKAWSMLSQYVQEGGNLFVDTGWQYWSQDWGKIDDKGQSLTIVLPEILPVKQTKWGEIGTYWRDLKVDSALLGEEVSNQGWADLVWEDKPWGMSLAEPQDLREFARPLATAAGKVIVAGGNYGQGKVVWSGMNLFGHTSYNESDSENDFLLAVFSWLTSLDQNQETDLNFERITPDKIVVQIDKTFAGERKVMFKEAMAPGWRAYLNLGGKSKELPIIKVGPGWKLVLLPEEFSTGTLTFVYGRTAKDWLFISISILTGLGMVLYLLNGLLKGAISTKLIPIQKVRTFLTRRFYSFKKDWEDEET